MIRKLFWLIAVIAVACVVTNLVERSRTRKRRELWAEAMNTR